MTLESLERLGEQLKLVTSDHQLALMDKELEIEAASRLIEEAGLSIEGNMDEHFHALEKTLIDIADEL